MRPIFSDVHVWRAASAFEKISAVQAAIARLPEIGDAPLECADVERFRCGDHAEETVVVVHGDAEFVVVPGATGLRLGRPDASSLPATLRDAWAKRYEKGFGDLETFLLHTTSAPRQVDVAPLLIERTPQLIGLTDDGSFPRHGDLVRQLAEEGWRLPTNDEWEWAYAGGSTSLFPWGDDLAFTHAPTFVSAFGLEACPSISTFFEVVHEPRIARGHDGGCLASGDGGGVPSTLLRLTSFAMEQDWDYFDAAQFRRARSLGQGS